MPEPVKDSDKYPIDAQFIRSLLAECGMTQYAEYLEDPLLKYLNKVLDLTIEKACEISTAAHKNQIDQDDVKLALAYCIPKDLNFDLTKDSSKQ